ncbi:MAG: cysteine methyltransferase [Proteobacteria bacterium]|nr:cysteine methyltransferase [Pseudomonadota bacterium]
MSDAGFDAVVTAPGFALGVRIAGDAVAEIEFLPPATPARAPRDELARRACRQLEAYLGDADTRFDLPLQPRGTPFQQRVWRAIRAIPCGTTATYGALARGLGSAPRAVGQACGANPYPVVVPCHRVVSAAGVGGFAHARDGLLIEVKRWLLAHEQAR